MNAKKKKRKIKNNMMALDEDESDKKIQPSNCNVNYTVG